jgi:hypothetical protein
MILIGTLSLPVLTETSKGESYDMKLVARVFFILAISIISISTANARRPPAQQVVIVPGIYENFTVGKDSGDLEGMRVTIMSVGGGYYAIVQIAQGGAEDPKPEFVPAEVKGRTVSFSVGDQKYTGTVSATAMTVKNGAGDSQILKRKACSTLFK